VFSSTHRRDVDDTANAHSSAVSCSHTTLELAPVTKSCKQNSHRRQSTQTPAGRALYMLGYDTIYHHGHRTKCRGEEKGQGEDESWKLCVEDGSHG
jgi:hypothetical protein